jgi:hypothetical protein
MRATTDARLPAHRIDTIRWYSYHIRCAALKIIRAATRGARGLAVAVPA